jgi:D-arginine dehydrogenase
VESADVVVIGGGIAGLSLAAELAPHLRLVLIEAESELAHHTSGRSARQMQPSYGPDPIRSATRRTIDEVRRLEAEHDTVFLRPRPLLWVAGDHEETLLQQLLTDVPALQLLTRTQALERLPLLRPEATTAALLDTEAYEVDVDALLALHRRRAMAGGAQILLGTRVTGSRHLDGRWRLETTAQVQLEAPVVVDAAGPWADQVAELLGARRRGLVPHRRTVGVSAETGRRVDPDWPMACRADGSFYVRPHRDGVLVSLSEEVASEPEDAQPRPGDLAEIRRRTHLSTVLTVGAFSAAWTGLRTLAPDHLPVLGFDSAVPGLFWLAGQGGYGFQTSSALARAAAGRILGRDDPTSADVLTVPTDAPVPDRHAAVVVTGPSRGGGSAVDEQPTVHRQGVPGDPGRVRGGQERDRGSNVLGLSHPTQRVQRKEEVGATVLVVPDPGPDGAGSHTVDADPVGGEAEREVAGQGDDAGLGGGIGFAAQRREGVDGADGDDGRGPGAPTEVRDGRPAATDHSQQVELGHPPPHLVVGVLERPVPGVAAGHVDQHVERSLCRGRERVVHRRLLGDVQGEGPVPTAGKLQGHPVRGHPVEVGDQHPCPLGGEPLSARPPDAVGCTGDQGHRSVETSGQGLHRRSLTHCRALRSGKGRRRGAGAAATGGSTALPPGTTPR